LSSASRALQVLEYLAVVQSASHGELAVALGIRKSTLSDLLGEMHDFGALAADGPRHALGPRAISLAHRIRHAGDVPALRDLLEAICEATGETTFFSVETGGNEHVAGAILPIECVESDREMKVAATVGRPRPMLETAAGRLLLALTGRRSSSHPRRVSNGWSPGSQNAREIRDDARLDAELDRIAQQGYCVQERHDDHIVSVAAPVYAEAAHLIGVISVAGPTFRMTDPEGALLVALRREIAHHGMSPTPRLASR
jgi:IclR family KDG regulon transcriptional repressor